MAQKRKLQVFVSSTFTDLIVERQAAVEAILTTSHIPAGMELFADKNVEQMEIIKDWINESDVYLLLLGGRYGSVEETSSKSYTQLEYEYARSQGKTVFVVVATDEYIKRRVKDNPNGAEGIMELEYRKEYQAFKKEVTGKYVKYWDTLDQLKLAIINTLHVIDRDETLIGWVPGSEATNSGEIAEQLALLIKENKQLKERLSSPSSDVNLYGGLTFDETFETLNRIPTVDFFTDEGLELWRVSKISFNWLRLEPTAVDYLLLWYLVHPRDELVPSDDTEGYVFEQIEELSLIDDLVQGRGFGSRIPYKISRSGLAFCLKIKLMADISDLQSAVTEFRNNGYQLFDNPSPFPN